MMQINPKHPSPGEAAIYIEQVTTELREMATRSGYPFLAYLIEMAREEAAMQAAKHKLRGMRGGS